MASMRETKKSNRGFASMDPEKQRLIARKGGQSVPMKSAASRKTRSWPQARAAKAVRLLIPVNAVFLAITRLLQRPVGKAAMPLIALPSRDQLPSIVFPWINSYHGATPGMNDAIAIEVVDCCDAPIFQLLFGRDTDMTKR